jgi:Xaa-Pro aminopeptidase
MISHACSEPGYYEDGNFGIRIESVMVVQEAATPFQFNNVYYSFDTIALV